MTRLFVVRAKRRYAGSAVLKHDDVAGCEALLNALCENNASVEERDQGACGRIARRHADRLESGGEAFLDHDLVGPDISKRGPLLTDRQSFRCLSALDDRRELALRLRADGVPFAEELRACG